MRKGFIITITKIDEDVDLDYLSKLLKNKLLKNDLNIRKRTRKIIYPARIIYSFNSLEEVSDLAKVIDTKFTGESYLYKLRNTFYLLLKSIRPFNYNKVEMLLNEYGNKINNSTFFEGYLNEYGDLMIEKNTLEVLKTYF